MKREETGDGEDNGEKKMDKYKYVWAKCGRGRGRGRGGHYKNRFMFFLDAANVNVTELMVQLVREDLVWFTYV